MQEVGCLAGGRGRHSSSQAHPSVLLNHSSPHPFHVSCFRTSSVGRSRTKSHEAQPLLLQSVGVGEWGGGRGS